MKRNLQTVKTFAENSPFTAGQLRWFIFNEATNGLKDAGAFVRIQRRIYIDVDKFEAWIDKQQSPARPTCPHCHRNIEL